MTTTDALIVAAGSGSRFGAALPKQYHLLQGAPVLTWTMRAFTGHPAIRRTIAVINPDFRDIYDGAARGLPMSPPVAGGETRQDSVRLGLESLTADPPDLVLIHDGARPLVSAAVIDRVIAGTRGAQGAIAALAINDTIKRANTDDVISDTIDRTGLWRAQTPQGFAFQAILNAHRQATGKALTDDAAVIEAAGGAVRIVRGDPDNVKVTVPENLTYAERLMDLRLGDTRTGIGFDVHRFGPDAHTPSGTLILCGVPVPHDVGLEGHSDADVGLHAITDAILGALGDGDIGSHFPPSDPQWRGAASDRFLVHAADLVRQRDGRISHVDVTLICERPKIGPHRERMAARIAEILGVSRSRVSVKATTTERLGFTGRGEGIAAQAVATLRLPDVDQQEDGGD